MVGRRRSPAWKLAGKRATGNDAHLRGDGLGRDWCALTGLLGFMAVAVQALVRIGGGRYRGGWGLSGARCSWTRRCPTYV